MLIPHLHETLRSARIAKEGTGTYRAAKGTHKEYPRMPQIVLPEAEAFKVSLGDAMDKRQSFSESGHARPLFLQELGTLLGHALGMRTESLRHYPSGGALFPIETYLIGDVLYGHAPGVFHYHPKNHALECLWDVPRGFAIADVLRPGSIVPQGTALVVFTSVWERSAKKYGDFAYLNALLEAGHMAQNILLGATALNISARPLNGFADAAISQLLDISGGSEQPVYSVLLSPAAAGEKNL